MNAAPRPSQMRTVAAPAVKEAAQAAKTVLDWLDRGAPRSSLPAPELRFLAAFASDGGEIQNPPLPINQKSHVPLDHEPIRVEERPLFRWIEVLGLLALAVAGMVATWFGAR